jgi:hypothetical protein
MTDFDTLYTASLVAANTGTAGVMYLLGSGLLTAVLGVLGVVVLLGATLTEHPASRSESGATETDGQAEAT